jgi:arylsulfatase A-like enzyme
MSNFLGDKAYAFLQNHSESGRPFILYVMMFEPHPPYNGPYNDMYDPSSIPDGQVFLEKPDDKSSLFNRARSDYYLGGNEHDLNTADDWRRLRARYYGNVTLLDEGVGKVLQGLTDFGFEDDTAVIFTSDHGDSLGDRGMLNKRSFYEEVSRVPMLMKVPWLNIDQIKIGGNFGHVDIVPTLLDILGIEIPDHLQGSTVLGDISKGSDLHARDVFMQWHGGLPTVNLGDDTVNLMSQIEWRSVVSGDRWKLNLSRGDQCELFDLNSDPFEKVNLFDSDDQKDRIREMTARIRGWQIATGDNLVLPAV